VRKSSPPTNGRGIAIWRRIERCVSTTAEEILPFVDRRLFEAVPGKFLEHQTVLPVRRVDGTLEIATCLPHADVPELAEALGASKPIYILVTPSDFRRMRSRLLLGITEGVAPREEVREVSTLGAKGSDDAEMVAITEAVLLEAITRRASDIHLEQYASRVRLRLRIDGDLHDMPAFNLTPEQLCGVVNVVKIRAHLDIAEHRLPQGGRFSAASGGAIFDLRVQTQPALHGEHVVIRLLPQTRKVPTLAELGLPAEVAAAYTRLINSPSGLLLITGPTGSGKSTTLYAGLSMLAGDATRKVITIEDPIEYAVEGVQQSQVQRIIGFDFADAVRSFVRQDPDVIMIGEIRDAETALECIRASQTGHVVLSTLHCNESVDAVQRLLDLGVTPNSIQSELLGIFSQRLAKRLCVACRKEHDPAPALLNDVFADDVPDDFRCFASEGCSQCDAVGSSGRVAIVEYLPIDAALRRAIARNSAVDEMRAVALRSGLVPMRDHALNLVADGIIALEELPLIFSPDQLRPRPRRTDS
jgi:type IV pilus assembly protein PilB